MNPDTVKLAILQTLLNSLGRDFVTEDVIRDTLKIYNNVFPNNTTEATSLFEYF